MTSAQTLSKSTAYNSLQKAIIFLTLLIIGNSISPLFGQVSTLGFGYSPKSTYFKEFLIAPFSEDSKREDIYSNKFNTVDIYYEMISYGVSFKFDINFGINNELFIISPGNSISNIGGFTLNAGKFLNPGKRLQFFGYFKMFDVVVIKRNDEFDVGMGLGAEFGLKFYLTKKIGLGGSIDGRYSYMGNDEASEKFTLGKGYRLSGNIFYSFSKK